MGEPPSSCLIQLTLKLFPLLWNLASSLGALGSPGREGKPTLNRLGGFKSPNEEIFYLLLVFQRSPVLLAVHETKQSPRTHPGIYLWRPLRLARAAVVQLQDKESPGLHRILPAAFNKYAASRGKEIDEVL